MGFGKKILNSTAVWEWSCGNVDRMLDNDDNETTRN